MAEEKNYELYSGVTLCTLDGSREAAYFLMIICLVLFLKYTEMASENSFPSDLHSGVILSMHTG